MCTSSGESPSFIIIKVCVAPLTPSRGVSMSQNSTSSVKGVKVSVICKDDKKQIDKRDNEICGFRACESM